MSPIPITVFTGFLGAGKTSIILSLLSQLPKDYKVVLLKNEFGDIQVDSKLAQQSSLMAVSEILNGCMCCVLVGQMQTALLEIRQKYRPNRIIIETSGSAFPATLAFQIRALEHETNGDLKLDAIVTVIDAENFAGYEDTSPTAKMQASYTDIILINKWEHISERALDLVIDHLHTLNDLTPKLRCHGRGGVEPNLIFGIGSRLFLDKEGRDLPPAALLSNHNNEVETVTVYRGSAAGRLHHHHPWKKHDHDGAVDLCDCTRDGVAQTKDTSGSVPQLNAGLDAGIDLDTLVGALGVLPKDVVWRVKGFVQLKVNGVQILNWAFGRYDLTLMTLNEDLLGGEAQAQDGALVKLTIMGERGEVKWAARKFATVLSAEVL